MHFCQQTSETSVLRLAVDSFYILVTCFLETAACFLLCIVCASVNTTCIRISLEWIKQTLEECRGANKLVLRENCTGHINPGRTKLEGEFASTKNEPGGNAVRWKIYNSKRYEQGLALSVIIACYSYIWLLCKIQYLEYGCIFPQLSFLLRGSFAPALFTRLFHPWLYQTNGQIAQNAEIKHYSLLQIKLELH